jgi:hypothetical protein
VPALAIGLTKQTKTPLPTNLYKQTETMPSSNGNASMGRLTSLTRGVALARTSDPSPSFEH